MWQHFLSTSWPWRASSDWWSARGPGRWHRASWTASPWTSTPSRQPTPAGRPWSPSSCCLTWCWLCRCASCWCCGPSWWACRGCCWADTTWPTWCVALLWACSTSAWWRRCGCRLARARLWSPSARSAGAPPSERRPQDGACSRGAVKFWSQGLNEDTSVMSEWQSERPLRMLQPR